MSDKKIAVEYNQELEQFSTLLAQIDRPGHYVTSGAWSGPLPTIQVEGVGTLAFPLLSTQAADIAAAAEEAPYGRGEETVYDPNVRRTRQIAADALQISGKTWQESFQEIMQRVVDGLGCRNLEVEAELYKLLLYETGGHFAPHRDTEKSEGMFATLVISLPSPHTGGDLLVSHGDETQTISLITQEASELRYAAFYADCLHEVRPVETGNRLCLVYNLVHRPKSKKKAKPPTAPDYTRQEQMLAQQLIDWSRTSEPSSKIVWLLEHSYTPAGISFATLKGVDAARATALQRAAESAGFDLYLGILHIEEYGPAEIYYSDYDYHRRYRYRNWYGGDEKKEPEQSEYEVVEVTESDQYISNWCTPHNQPVDLGQVPLQEEELLPDGALDNEVPDKERVTEATGNEGASFERSYLRAVLVLWPCTGTIEVLMAAGSASAVGYLNHFLSQSPASTAQQQTAAIAMARSIINNWSSRGVWGSSIKGSGMDLMLCILARLRDRKLVVDFIESIIQEHYEVGINDGLVECFFRLPLKDQIRLGQGLIQRMLQDSLYGEAIAFVHSICGLFQLPELTLPLAEQLVAALPDKQPGEEMSRYVFQRDREAIEISDSSIAKLFEVLRITRSTKLTDQALDLIKRHPAIYPPDTILAHGMLKLRKALGKGFAQDPGWVGLWQTTAHFLIGRSANPPKPPTDWKLPVKKGCQCEDCIELMQFAVDPNLQQKRFPLNKDRRMHLHHRIEWDQMDMTHETERSGRPYTLVCTKTRRSFERRQNEYAQDLKIMNFLVKTAPANETETVARLQAALAAQ
ncbi:MAG: 2OG-Fe(II) oxygenase [Verrucomicrobiota bacterium]|nr:2OG-Fe(II) oxygenase [Verrucomicrobiota bacterium]